MIDRCRERAMAADRQKRDILEFIHATGFDVIDQKYTDMLIAEIKNNSLHVEGLNLNSQRLDISRGVFGEAETEE